MNLFLNICFLLFIGPFMFTNAAVRIDLGIAAVAIPSDIVGGLTNMTKCLGPLGCFNSESPFYQPLRRPISLLPYDRSLLDVIFRLYTRTNPEKGQILAEDESDSLIKSNFKPEAKTQFIVHGFIDSIILGKWIKDMKDDLLSRGDYNVITVDWARANKFPYAQAVANTRAVGAEIALLINKLQEVCKADPKLMHIIGHSLGAHIAGYAGERLKNLGRITGLDPAGPYYTDTDPKVRLDPTDALFVDVIHTDAARSVAQGLGTVNSVGHLDFFPNDGLLQPGCNPVISAKTVLNFFKEGPVDGMRQALACGHQRAVALFHDSILPKHNCLFVGLKCASWTEFLRGKCGDCGVDGSHCAVMGFDSDKYYYMPDAQTGDSLLKTSGDDTSFCLHQYHVTVDLDNPKEARVVEGKADVIVRGTKANLRAQLSKGKETFHPGTSYAYFVSSKKDIGQLDSVDFTWNATLQKRGILGSLTSGRVKPHRKLYVRNVHVSPLTVPLPKERSAWVTAYRLGVQVPKSGILIASGTTVRFMLN